MRSIALFAFVLGCGSSDPSVFGSSKTLDDPSTTTDGSQASSESTAQSGGMVDLGQASGSSGVGRMGVGGSGGVAANSGSSGGAGGIVASAAASSAVTATANGASSTAASSAAESSALASSAESSSSSGMVPTCTYVGTYCSKGQAINGKQWVCDVGATLPKPGCADLFPDDAQEVWCCP